MEVIHVPLPRHVVNSCRAPKRETRTSNLCQSHEITGICGSLSVRPAGHRVAPAASRGRGSWQEGWRFCETKSLSFRWSLETVFASDASNPDRPREHGSAFEGSLLTIFCSSLWVGVGFRLLCGLAARFLTSNAMQGPSAARPKPMLRELELSSYKETAEQT